MSSFLSAHLRKLVHVGAVFALAVFSFAHVLASVQVNLLSIQYWRVAGTASGSISPALEARILSAHPHGVEWLAYNAVRRGDGGTALSLLNATETGEDQFQLSIQALAYEVDGEYPKAISIWEDLQNLFELKRLENAAINAGYLDEVLSAYYAFWRLDPGSDSAASLAKILLQAKDDPVEAESVLRASLEARPNSAHRSDWLLFLGTALQEQNRWNEAIDIYQTVIQEEPDNGYAYIRLGWVYYHLGDRPEEAQAQFLKAIETNPANEKFYLETGRFLMRENKYAEALAVYQDTLARFPNSHDAYYGIAQAYLLLEQIQPAIAAIEKAISMNPSDVYDYRRAAAIYIAAGDKEKAIFYCQQVLAIVPDDERAKRDLETLTGGK